MLPRGCSLSGHLPRNSSHISRIVAEEAEVARLAERNRWLQHMDEATVVSVAVELVQRAAEAHRKPHRKPRCLVCPRSLVALATSRSHVVDPEPEEPAAA